MTNFTNYNVIYFDTDDDFYEFSVIPKIIQREFTNKNGEVDYYGDFDLSPAYYDGINNSTIFIIKDPKSQIIKHGNVVSYRTISKKVDNLKPWYYGKIYDKKFENLDNND